MPGILNLTFKPAIGATPGPGTANAIYRGDTYAHIIRFWNDDEETDAFDIEGDVTAQIRTARLTAADETPGDPLATFTVQVVDNAITVSLTPEQTLELPSAGFWDLQVDNEGVLTTLLMGKVKVLDDVTR